ncbi:MAG: hypothetical protein K9K30_11510 [Burkholderiaceae bacterium]|nr:hypothetical protein [Sulfuritalea sp.]MCF8175855.1 hypothetical protein [Burkholderiaceae bacterium]MCF8184706.1 hypothetical protein [Polynucleobacter sp.]
MTEFQRLYTGRVWSVLSWDQLTALWQRIDPAAGWYLQAVGVASPGTASEAVAVPPAGPVPADPSTVKAFIAGIDALLRADHQESYCGIVYADDLENPRLIKIFDPNNLGSSCGSSKNPPPPGWIMSRVAPDEIVSARPAPENRKRWWRSLLGDS